MRKLLPSERTAGEIEIRKIRINNFPDSARNKKFAYVRWSLLVAAFVVFSLLLFFHFTQGVFDKSVPQNQIPQNPVATKAPQGPAVRLIIPAINVNANIQHIGVNPKGEMEVPTNIDDVGWFKMGSRPGEKGSAVISGHFNGSKGEAGVFFNLYKLKNGDKLYIEDAQGTSITFIVRETRTYNPGYADDVFSNNDGFHLNLVTCDGVWDGAKKSYSKRLVVFADITP